MKDNVKLAVLNDSKGVSVLIALATLEGSNVKSITEEVVVSITENNSEENDDSLTELCKAEIKKRIISALDSYSSL
jgi:hypothetical protein